VLVEIYFDVEIMFMGVEELKCLIYVLNESVDLIEIENIVLFEVLFFEKYVRMVVGEWVVEEVVG